MPGLEKEIEDALREAKTPLRPKEIAQLTGVNANTVRGMLFHFRREGKVKKPKRGFYEHV